MEVHIPKKWANQSFNWDFVERVRNGDRMARKQPKPATGGDGDCPTPLHLILMDVRINDYGRGVYVGMWWV